MPTPRTFPSSQTTLKIMMKIHTSMLIVATTAWAAVAAVPSGRFGMGDLSDAMGATVGGGSDEGATAGVADLDQFFEPQGRTVPFRQEAPEDVERVATHTDGFEAVDVEFDCGDHGCAEAVSVVTVVSGEGSRRSETTDRTTSLTRSPSTGGALWTLQQAPNSCSLSWFNASWPLVSSYEVLPHVYGAESCIKSPGSIWIGMFQFEDSSAVDALFERICGGHVDLRWTLLGDHVERIAPSTALNPTLASHVQRLESVNLELGPTDTASAAVAARKRLEASGTVFMVVRNGCSGPATLEVRQSLMARVELSLAHTFDVLDALIVALVIGASALFVYSAMLLCEAMKTLDELENALDRELDEGDAIAKVSSLPPKVHIDRTSSTSSSEEPLLKAEK